MSPSDGANASAPPRRATRSRWRCEMTSIPTMFVASVPPLPMTLKTMISHRARLVMSVDTEGYLGLTRFFHVDALEDLAFQPGATLRRRHGLSPEVFLCVRLA